MGRKSLAEHLFEKYQDHEPGIDTFLVIYDFKQGPPSTRFYYNLNRIKNMIEDGQVTQHNVLMTKNRRAALAIKDLIQHYHGKVRLLK